jgi:hypothetical protein
MNPNIYPSATVNDRSLKVIRSPQRPVRPLQFQHVAPLHCPRSHQALAAP